MNVNNVLPYIGCVIAVATFFIGRMTASKAEGKEEGSFSTDLKYIKESVQRIEKQLNNDVTRLEGRIDEHSSQFSQIATTATKAHEASKSAHKRLDEHLEREHGMTVINRRDDE